MFGTIKHPSPQPPGVDGRQPYGHNQFGGQKNQPPEQILKRHDYNSCPNKFNKTVKCKQCDKPFQGKAALMSPIKVHDIKTSVLTKLKCHICPKEILKKNSQNHLNTHSKIVGSFEKCPQESICNKFELKFSNTFSLKRHTQTLHKVNSGSVGSNNGKNINNNYSCSKCPLKFASNYSLKRHMKTIHKVTCKSVTVRLNQDESILCEYMNSFLNDVIAKAVTFVEEEKEKNVYINLSLTLVNLNDLVLLNNEKPKEYSVKKFCLL